MSDDQLDRMRQEEPDRRLHDTAGTGIGMTVGIVAVAVIIIIAALLYWLL